MPFDTNSPAAVRRTGRWLSGIFAVVLVAAGAFMASGDLGARLSLGATAQLVIVALLSGALGGSIHVATSFADYVGNGKYDSRWLWWYALRPLIGAGLAFIFLCAAKAKWIPIATDGTTGVWAVAALSAMVGLFSKQALDKLDDVFDQILKTNKDTSRAGGLDDGPATAVITGISPSEVAAGSGAQKVSLTGTHLPARPLVHYAGKAREAAYKDASRSTLEVSLLAEDVASAGDFAIAVWNAALGADGPAAAGTSLKVKIPLPGMNVVGEAIAPVATGATGSARAPSPNGSDASNTPDAAGAPAAAGAAGAAGAVGAADATGAPIRAGAADPAPSGSAAGGAAAPEPEAEHPVQVPDEDESGGEAEAPPQEPRGAQIPVGAGAGTPSGVEVASG